MRRRIHIDPLAGAAILWLVFAERSVWAWISLCAAGLHELGHLAAAKLLHIRPDGMTVSMLGARISFGRSLLSYRDEALIAAAGPAVNLACAGLTIPLCRALPDDRLLFFAAASLALAGINLLPLATFDGGRILACLCAQLFGTAAADSIGRAVGASCTVLLWLAASALTLRTGGNLSLTVLATLLVCRAVAGNVRGGR